MADCLENLDSGFCNEILFASSKRKIASLSEQIGLTQLNQKKFLREAVLK